MISRPRRAQVDCEKRETRPDIKPVAIFRLPDELEVNTSIAVQESCNIGRL